MTMLGVILYIMSSDGGLVLHDNYLTMDQCVQARDKVVQEMEPRLPRLKLVCVPHYDFSEAKG